MEVQTWANELTDAFRNLGQGIIEFLPKLVIAVLIILLGWIVGVGIGKAVAQLVKALRVDVALRNAGVEEVFERTGYKLNAGAILGWLVKWFIIIVFLIAAFDVLGLTDVNAFLSEVVLVYLPRVIIAVLILLAAAIIADIVEKLIIGATKASRLGSPYFLGSVAKWAIWIFAILAALNQLNVGTVFIQTLFTGVVIAFSLAIGLSFGLGGQATAAHYIEDTRMKLEGKKDNRA